MFDKITGKIERGILVFPETGCELLISQLTGFGIEKHDDLVDALTVAVIEITNRGDTGGTVYVSTHDLWNGGGPQVVSHLDLLDVTVVADITLLLHQTTNSSIRLPV